MENLLIYIFKTSALLGIFYLCYLFLLKKETSFQLNRKFLIAGIITAAVLPSIYFTKVIYIQASTSSMDFIPVTSEMMNTPVEAQMDWWQITGIIYLLVTGFFLLRLILQLTSVLNMILTTKKVKQGGFNYLKIEENQLPFSFFNFIVFNPANHSARDLDLILEHEKVHARQWHSADILLVNLASCILWFNPFAWFYKRSVEQNLEFIADRETVNNKAQIKEYQHALVKVSIADLKPALTNHFYQSFIKKRILMLNKKSSTNSPAWKLGLLMPLLLAFMLFFNVKTEAQVVENEKSAPSPVQVESEEPEEELEFEAEEEVEFEEEIEEPEEVEVETVEAPEIKWEARSNPRRNPTRELGNNPLYVLNGKQFKASKLSNKYIGLDSELEVLIGEQALNRYGKDARNGVIIIPNAEIIRNFDKEMKDIREKDHFNGRYILVGNDGKPNFVSLNAGNRPSPPQAVHFALTNSAEPVYAVRNVRTWKTRTVPNAKNTYVVRNIRSTESNSDENHTYEFRSGNSQTMSYSLSENAPAAYSVGSDVNIITEDGEPLYVVDGEIQDKDFDRNSLKPNDIAHINVLKGKAAIEKYGKKAKDGVIEIHTKDSDYSASTQKLVKIHAKMSDSELEATKTKLKVMTGIELTIDNISRNDGLITSIRVRSELDGTQISNGHFEDTNSIPNIYVGLVNGKAVVKSTRD